MAGSSLLMLLDDIATILDDVALLSKVAAKKTAAVLGDDLALNAQQVAGVQADRELPVVWAVAKGSLKNKLILVPAALAISAFIPWLITPLLMIGGAYLCYEGFEKIAHHLWHPKPVERAEHLALIEAVADPEVDLVAFEKDKIKGAVRTDFILSAEIIVIALGTVKEANFSTQVAVVAGIALLITVGVYGLVALIVKLDDMGLHLLADQALSFWAKLKRAVGQGLLAFAPLLMKALGYLGTIAMFLVGGGILLHGVHVFEPMISHWQTLAEPAAGSVLASLIPVMANLVFGMLAGALVLVGVTLVNKLRSPKVSW